MNIFINVCKKHRILLLINIFKTSGDVYILHKKKRRCAENSDSTVGLDVIKIGHATVATYHRVNYSFIVIIYQLLTIQHRTTLPLRHHCFATVTKSDNPF